MKKLILFVITIFAFIGVSNAQEENPEINVYVSAGLSISNTGDTTTFLASSYPSIELGIMKNGWSTALSLGRENNYIKESDNKYWWEIKTSLQFPMWNFTGYGIIGIGNYIATKRIFIEYGAGFSYSWNKFGVFSQVSNWDGIFYITPGFSYTF